MTLLSDFTDTVGLKQYIHNPSKNSSWKQVPLILPACTRIASIFGCHLICFFIAQLFTSFRAPWKLFTSMVLAACQVFPTWDGNQLQRSECDHRSIQFVQGVRLATRISGLSVEFCWAYQFSHIRYAAHWALRQRYSIHQSWRWSVCFPGLLTVCFCRNWTVKALVYATDAHCIPFLASEFGRRFFCSGLD